VPEPYRSVLDDYRRGLGDALATPAHITLLPPTDVDDTIWAALPSVLAAVAARHEPFTVRLRGTGTFRPVSPVVFVGVVDGVGCCERLEADLRMEALASGRRFPYHPHVTIAHDVGEADLDRAFADHAGFEATFDVASFTLYRGDTGGWTAVRKFPLSGSARPGPGYRR
jgi:2'-5' RNA ligase